jgi:hypothetical protein
MHISVPALADCLQTLFSTDADRLARTTGLIRRQRQLTGHDFAQVLVFGWTETPDASLDDLADDLPLSPQALHQRINASAVEFFAALFRLALSHVLTADSGLALLARFSAVYLDDCTYLSLPAELADQFPGCGGSTPQVARAALKLFIRWDVTHGDLAELTMHPARTNDRTAQAAATPLPANSLKLADRGFYNGAVLTADTQAGVRWITRVPANLAIRLMGQRYQALVAFLGRQRQDVLDVDVTAGVKEPVPGRLLAWRVPAAVRRKRLARLQKRCAKLGRVASAAQRRMCSWTVLLTNLPRDEFNPQEVLVLAKIRWQMELLIKRFKSLGGVDKSRGHLRDRVLCELYAKLVGQLVVLWSELLSGGPLSGAGCWRKAKRVRRRMRRLFEALGNRRRLRRELRQLRSRLRRLRVTTRRTNPTTRQLLLEPTLVT